jgi:hypothetical protein
MGGTTTTLPTASTPGYGWYTDAYGNRWVGCDCLRAWLPVYQQLLKAMGLIQSNIDIWQLTGGAAASGGTHSQGGVYDLLYQTSPAHIAVAREMGAPAAWGRTVAQGFTRSHHHGVLTGCPHNAPAAYQILAQKRGYNGLGQGAPGTAYAGMWGYGGRDEYPDPKVYRTWQQGITWAKEQIALIEKQENPLMGMTVQDPGNGNPTPVDEALYGMWARIVATDLRTAAMAKQIGVDIDEAAVARDLFGYLKPALEQAVTTAAAAAAPGATPEQVAAAVVAALSAKLGA